MLGGKTPRTGQGGKAPRTEQDREAPRTEQDRKAPRTEQGGKVPRTEQDGEAPKTGLAENAENKTEGFILGSMLFFVLFHGGRGEPSSSCRPLLLYVTVLRIDHED